MVTCLQLLFDTHLYSFDGTSSFFSCAVLMSRAPPSSMLPTVRQGWNRWSVHMDEETDESSDLESKGNSDPERDSPCMAAPRESSSKVEWATGRENERASRWGNNLPSTCRPAAGSALNPGPTPGAVPAAQALNRGLDVVTADLSREEWASSWLMELEKPPQRFGRCPFLDPPRTQCPRVTWAPRRMRLRSLRFQRRRCRRKGSLNSRGLGIRKSLDMFWMFWVQSVAWALNSSI